MSFTPLKQFTFCEQGNPHTAGGSRLEILPAELLSKIVYSVVEQPTTKSSCYNSRTLSADPNAKGVKKESSSLLPCLLTSRTIFGVTLRFLYRSIVLEKESCLEKFLAQLTRYPQLGLYVRDFDLSQLIPTMKTNEAEEIWKIGKYVESCMSLMPLLHGFYFIQNSRAHLPERALRQLHYNSTNLRILDLSKSDSPTLADTLSNLLCSCSVLRTWFSLTYLNIGGCRTFPPNILEAILPRLPKLRALHAADTNITTTAVKSLPTTARLTHLDLRDCHLLNGKDLAEFFAAHPSVTSSVTVLCLGNRGKTEFLSPDDISQILAKAPPTLKSLDLRNTAMDSSHVSHLRVLARQLEELSIGSNLSMRDMENVLLSPDYWNVNPDVVDEELPAMESKFASVLGPMEKAAALCKLRQRLNSVVLKPAAGQSGNWEELKPSLRYLDISSLALDEQRKIRRSVLLSKETWPLEVIEICERVSFGDEVLPKVCKAVRWDPKWRARRSWLVRSNLKRERCIRGRTYG